MQEVVILHSPGPIAGFPGASHGPGAFLLDYDARTVTPVPPAQEQPPVQEHTPPPVEAAPIDASAQGV